MIVKLLLHYMPWEVDYAMFNMAQFKRSSFYMPSDIKIQLHCVLNTSDYIIDWSKSKLPKEFFVDKFNALKPLMYWTDIERFEVVETDKLYGHLNMQREAYSDSVDGYVLMCPDMNFSKYLLPLMCENAKYIDNDYFIMTAEIYKMWDQSWDCITNQNYMGIDYSEWDKSDAFRLENESTDNADDDASIRVSKAFKFAGWFDYYNKAFANKLLRVPESWTGYGPWDFYSLLVLGQIKASKLPIDVEQYILKNQVVYSYNNGDLKTDKISGFSGYYKKQLSLKTIENQRAVIENRMGEHVQNWFNDYSNGRIV